MIVSYEKLSRKLTQMKACGAAREEVLARMRGKNMPPEMLWSKIDCSHKAWFSNQLGCSCQCSSCVGYAGAPMPNDPKFKAFLKSVAAPPRPRHKKATKKKRGKPR
jgi:hypothetical protein